MYETWYKMTSLIQSGLDISPVITHRFPYTKINEAIELAKSGHSGKIVLDFDLEPRPCGPREPHR
jgi:threonine 3-dehydrogenase